MKTFYTLPFFILLFSCSSSSIEKAGGEQSDSTDSIISVNDVKPILNIKNIEFRKFIENFKESKVPLVLTLDSIIYFGQTGNPRIITDITLKPLTILEISKYIGEAEASEKSSMNIKPI